MIVGLQKTYYIGTPFDLRDSKAVIWGRKLLKHWSTEYRPYKISFFGF